MNNISTKFERVEEIHNFMGISNSPKLEIKNLIYFNKNQRHLNDNHKPFLKEAPGPVGFTGGFCQTSKEQIPPILCRWFQKIKKRGNCPIL